jgi:hypothetical protein
MEDARVIDEHVQTTVPGLDLLEERILALGPGYVNLDWQRLAAAGFDAASGYLGQVGPHVGNDDRRAGLGEAAGDRLTYTFPRTRDDRYLPVERTRHYPFTALSSPFII